MSPGAGTCSDQEANMSRRQPQLFAIAVVLSLLLAALPAAAQGRSPAGARPAQTADWVKVTWSFLSAFWSGAPASPAPQGLVSIRGGEGASLDPDGKAHTSGTTSAVVPPPPSAEGVSLDPHG
jgi:hypothetical protein